MRRGRNYILRTLGIPGVCLVLLPLFTQDSYWISLLVFTMIHMFVIIGLYVLQGMAGQISLGQAGFMALGAYGSTLLARYAMISPVLAIPLAVLASAFVGIVLGLPCLKLRGHYLAMATLGYGLAIFYMVSSLSITGGAEGYGDISRLKIFGVFLETERDYYYLLLIFLSLAIWMVTQLEKGYFGRVLKFIHFDESLAKQMGHKVSLFKLGAFVFAVSMASLGGAIYAHFLGYVGPEVFRLDRSIMYVVILVISGTKSLSSVVWGALFFTLLPEILRDFEDWQPFVYGGILILSIRFFPDGIFSISFRKKERKPA